MEKTMILVRIDSLKKRKNVPYNIIRKLERKLRQIERDENNGISNT